jgi:hypothetical protein
VTVQQMQKKRFKYEKEKRPEQIFSAKWCEGRPWLKYDRDENVMFLFHTNLHVYT